MCPPKPSPVTAWATLMRSTFPDSISLQQKTCPKEAFLGLFANGWITGIPVGDYTKSKLNRAYATRAVEALRRDPALMNDLNALWSLAVRGKSVAHNSQMHLVTALWNEGLIRSQ